MSKQINDIMSKNKDIFVEKGEEIKEFLLKNYKKQFEAHEIHDLKRIDASERIKTAGFQKALSSWRNYYRNIMITSCVEIKGDQKRYDYKFLFIEEKLDEDTIEKIQDALKESSKLVRAAKFDEARDLINQMLDSIKSNEDKVINKRLYNALNEIDAAEKEFKELSTKLKDLEDEFTKNQNDNDLKAMVKTADDITYVAKKLRNGPLSRKYKEFRDKAQEKLDLIDKLSGLEKEYNYHKEKRNLDAARDVCNQIITLAKENDKKDLEKKYSDLLNEINNEIKDILNKVDDVLKESSDLIKDGQIDDALSKIDATLHEIEPQQCKEYDDSKKKLHDKRKDALTEQETKLKTSADLEDLEQKLEVALEDKDLFGAQNYCNRILELVIDDSDLVDKYNEILEDINKKIEKLKEQIDNLMDRSRDLGDDFLFGVALSKINDMLGILGQELPEYKEKLEARRKEILATEEKYNKLINDIEKLDKLLKEYIDKKNYIAAYKICEQIIVITEKTEDPKLIGKYKTILADIAEIIKGIKDCISKALKDAIKLSNNKRFKIAITKLDALSEIIGKQDLPEEKEKIRKTREDILEEQEIYLTFSDDLVELEKQLQENMKNRQYLVALNNCDLLIQIAESYNNPDLIQKYRTILDQINSRIEEIKGRVELIMRDTSEFGPLASFKLISEFPSEEMFETIYSNIDSMVKFLEDYDFPDYIRVLESRRDNIAQIQKKEDFKKLILRITGEALKNLIEDDFYDSMNKYEEITKRLKDYV